MAACLNVSKHHTLLEFPGIILSLLSWNDSTG